MKKNIGSVMGLYPMPSIIIGTVIGDRVNWAHVAHLGIIGMDSVMISLSKSRYTNEGINENRTVSINLVSEDMLIEADYVGTVSGKTVDKSKVFKYHMGELRNAPIIDKSPLSMECEVIDNYETSDYNNFILKIVHTQVEEDKLNENGKIDYEKVRPILFELPTTSYLRTGDVVAKCWNIGKEYKNS